MKVTAWREVGISAQCRLGRPWHEGQLKIASVTLFDDVGQLGLGRTKTTVRIDPGSQLMTAQRSPYSSLWPAAGLLYVRMLPGCRSLVASPSLHGGRSCPSRRLSGMDPVDRW